MIKKCEHCEENIGKPTRFGVFLCDDCTKGMEELEHIRKKEESEEIERMLQGKYFEPTIAYVTWFKQFGKLASGVISNEKVPDFTDTGLKPLIALMPDEEAERLLSIVKDLYFHLNAAVGPKGMRKVERYREAEVIKKQQKSEKSVAKAEKEIAKQKKHASKDKTLSKEERAKATIIEGLMRMGLSEADAKRMAEVKK